MKEMKVNTSFIIYLNSILDELEENKDTKGEFDNILIVYADKINDDEIFIIKRKKLD